MGVYICGKHLTITGIFTCVEHCGVCMCVRESMGAIFTCVFGEVCMGVWVYSCVWQKCCECKKLPVWNSGMSWLTWHSQTWQAYQHQPNSLGSTHPCTWNSHSFPDQASALPSTLHVAVPKFPLLPLAPFTMNNQLCPNAFPAFPKLEPPSMSPTIPSLYSQAQLTQSYSASVSLMTATVQHSLPLQHQAS